MAIQVYPQVTGGKTFYTATSALTAYTANTDLAAGIYTVTCVSTTITYVDFLNDSTVLASTQTATGTVNVSLASVCNKINFRTNTGSNILIGIEKTGITATSNTISGTLDTITASTTYTTVSTSGLAYVVVVGGGQGGGQGNNSNQVSGDGGASGGINAGIVQLTGNVTATIGAQGNGVTGSGSIGNAGGATSFGSLTANGGNAGAAGTPGGANGPSGYYSNGGSPSASSSAPSGLTLVKSGTTGAGGNTGWINNDARSGAGSGIGTGGQGGQTSNAKNATGYGAGGGGTYRVDGGNSGNGSPGVVYVLRY